MDLRSLLNGEDELEQTLPEGVGVGQSNHLVQKLIEYYSPYNEQYKDKKHWFQMDDREE